MYSVTDLLSPGDVALLTTVGSTGPSTRPVVAQPDAAGRPGHIAFFTHGGRKLAGLTTHSGVTVATATDTGWLALEGTATPTTDSETGATRIDVEFLRGRVWLNDPAHPDDHAPREVDLGK